MSINVIVEDVVLVGEVGVDEGLTGSEAVLVLEVVEESLGNGDSLVLIGFSALLWVLYSVTGMAGITGLALLFVVVLVDPPELLAKYPPDLVLGAFAVELSIQLDPLEEVVGLEGRLVLVGELEP